MGDEARCTVRWNGRVAEGKALLETDELIFRGEFRLAVPLREIRKVTADEGRLVVESPRGTATFELGAPASRWAEKIRNPKTLLDKLGLEADSRVALVAVADEEFRRLHAERVGRVADGEAEPESDAIFLGAASRDDLGALRRLQRFLKPNGAIWVVAPKGGKEPREADVLAAGKDADLVDTKVVRFSDTHTAHKFVIPVARRSE